jgi:hypothetical protein
MQCLPQYGVLPHAVTVAANRHEVTVMDETIDQGGGHDLIAEDLAPLLKTVVGGRQHGRGVLVATRHRLKDTAPMSSPERG